MHRELRARLLPRLNRPLRSLAAQEAALRSIKPASRGLELKIRSVLLTKRSRRLES